jgi:hypothetical protein
MTIFSISKKVTENHRGVNPVRNSSGVLNPAGIILKSDLTVVGAAKQRGIISNGVNPSRAKNPNDTELAEYSMSRMQRMVMNMSNNSLLFGLLVIIRGIRLQKTLDK